MNRVVLCVILGASVVVGATTVAQAEEGRMKVRVADLNLTTQAGAQTALSRIRWSVGVFCEASPGLKSLERGVVVDRCVSDMTRKSVTQLNAPLVTALLDGGAAPPSAALALAQK